MRNEFSTLDIVKALGIPRERLRDWMNHGYIKPTTPAKGQGTKAIFTRKDVYGVLLFSNLLEKGFKRETASKHFHKIIENGLIEKTKYIVWRISTKYGKEIMLHQYLDELQARVDLKLGAIDWTPFDPAIQKIPIIGKFYGVGKELIEKAGEWEQIIIMNLDLIKRKVDVALSSLE